jgi:hypothetical protein
MTAPTKNSTTTTSSNGNVTTVYIDTAANNSGGYTVGSVVTATFKESNRSMSVATFEKTKVALGDELAVEWWTISLAAEVFPVLRAADIISTDTSRRVSKECRYHKSAIYRIPDPWLNTSFSHTRLKQSKNQHFFIQFKQPALLTMCDAQCIGVFVPTLYLLPLET